MGAAPSLLNEIMAGLGNPVVPEVYINISMSVKTVPFRRESGGLSLLNFESVSVEINSVHATLAAAIELSTIQIDRIPASESASLTPSTLAAISQSKMSNLASATVTQCINGFEVKLKLMRAGTAPMHSNPSQTNMSSGLFVKSIATWSMSVSPKVERGTS